MSNHNGGTEQGIASLLAPVILDMDKAITATQQSQDELGKEIERLVAGNKYGTLLWHSIVFNYCVCMRV